MKKQFVTYPIALALKELGFDEPCIYAWCQEKGGYTKTGGDNWLDKYTMRANGNPFGSFETGKDWNSIIGENKNRIQCSAPLWQQVEEWFREKHSLFIEIDLTDNTCAKYYQYCIVDSDDREYDDEEMIDQASHIYNFKDKYETYPKAREAAILKAIEIIKNK